VDEKVDFIAMRDIWVASDCVVSPLGNTTDENYRQVRAGKTGVKARHHDGISPLVYTASIDRSQADHKVSFFEAICRKAIDGVQAGVDMIPAGTLLVLSTTKGNVEYLESGQKDDSGIFLHTVAGALAQRYGLRQSIVISNACISGVLAMIVASRYLQRGGFDHALVIGADVLSKFIISGFQSLSALSADYCRPFDAERQGINLGEAAGCMLLTAAPEELGLTPQVRITGAGVSNDANHISGPSRTGEELGYAIRKALDTAKLLPEEIGFVSAHGTATSFNDEMEAKAFYNAALVDVPVHSLKGNFGHTLGAAGIIESIMSIQGLLQNEVLPTHGFERLGVSRPLQVSNALRKKQMSACLKTASGFGGCNAAVVFQKT
jgi:3-oxoacyl-[acyl-carrier-protein] synthase-1